MILYCVYAIMPSRAARHITIPLFLSSVQALVVAHRILLHFWLPCFILLWSHCFTVTSTLQIDLAVFKAVSGCKGLTMAELP